MGLQGYVIRQWALHFYSVQERHVAGVLGLSNTGGAGAELPAGTRKWYPHLFFRLFSAEFGGFGLHSFLRKIRPGGYLSTLSPHAAVVAGLSFLDSPRVPVAAMHVSRGSATLAWPPSLDWTSAFVFKQGAPCVALSNFKGILGPGDPGREEKNIYHFYVAFQSKRLLLGQETKARAPG